MANFGFDDMQAIQKELQEKYYDQWGGLYPEKAVRMLQQQINGESLTNRVEKIEPMLVERDSIRSLLTAPERT